ncbi:MAG: hypothetical protein WC942_11225, partial [Clostridia bacterium]
MNPETILKRIIDEFDFWYLTDPHSENVDYYANSITKNNLNSLNKQELIEFFYKFIEEGGKVQSGGDRAKNTFLATVNSNFEKFFQFILEPFINNFDIKDWFNRISQFNGFGVGVATIYLNRINRFAYPIMNNKTLNGLNKLGYNLSSTKNYNNYMLVKKHQDELINKFSILDNYYKADAFNHFLVAVYLGNDLANTLQEVTNIEDTIEQNIIESRQKEILNYNKEVDILTKIINCENDRSEIVVIKGKRYKRHNYLMLLIKKYRNFQCQFCSEKIIKKDGNFYIDACHVT